MQLFKLLFQFKNVFLNFYLVLNGQKANVHLHVVVLESLATILIQKSSYYIYWMYTVYIFLLYYCFASLYYFAHSVAVSDGSLHPGPAVEHES